MGNVRLGALIERVRGSFWSVPTLSLVVALVGGVLLPHVHIADDGQLSQLVFSGNPDAARGILQAIAGSVITVTSLTFSLTVVTLQLASSQFSPRLLRTFLRDLRNQTVLGIFLATFLYCLTVLRTIRSGGESTDAQVPKLAVTVAYLLVLSSVGALVWFIQHIVEVIRIDTLMRDVRGETHAVIERMHPADGPAEDRGPLELDGDVVAVPAPASGFLLAVDAERVSSWATEHDLVVAVDAQPGDWLLRGVPWARVAGAGPDPDLAQLSQGLCRSIAVGKERTAQQDTAFGLRQLVDVVAKALSPGVNDPTTAVHAIGHVSDLLVNLAGRPLGHRHIHGEDARLRADIAGPGFADYLELACGQSRRYGAAEPAVVAALLHLLDGVAVVLPTDATERLTAVRTQLDALASDAERAIESEHDRALVAVHVDSVRAALPSGAPSRGKKGHGGTLYN